jgi:hypothetical protein
MVVLGHVLANVLANVLDEGLANVLGHVLDWELVISSQYFRQYIEFRHSYSMLEYFQPKQKTNHFYCKSSSS